MNSASWLSVCCILRARMASMKNSSSGSLLKRTLFFCPGVVLRPSSAVTGGKSPFPCSSISSTLTSGISSLFWDLYPSSAQTGEALSSVGSPDYSSKDNPPGNEVVSYFKSIGCIAMMSLLLCFSPPLNSWSSPSISPIFSGEVVEVLALVSFSVS